MNDLTTEESLMEASNNLLTAAEAELIIGYLEGHDYKLAINDDNEMVMVDLTDGETQAYTIADAIDKVAEWNYQLLSYFSTFTEEYEKINALVTDETVIDALLERRAVYAYA